MSAVRTNTSILDLSANMLPPVFANRFDPLIGFMSFILSRLKIIAPTRSEQNQIRRLLLQHRQNFVNLCVTLRKRISSSLPRRGHFFGAPSTKKA